MIVSLKWLRNYVDVPVSVDELAHRLTMAGLEVEGVRPVNPVLEYVLTVRVEEVLPHPNAGRLRLCSASDGRRSYRVVCGAPNVASGQIAPLALPGAQFPNGVTLQETSIRGELSQGMLCSQKELGLGEDGSGIWVLPQDTPVGVPLFQALHLDDVVLDVGITPNRGDCLSILGIGREVAALCGVTLKRPSTAVEESGPPVESLASVAIEDAEGCPRYTARVVRGVTIGPSPAWLRELLEAVGLRSINNIVDVTNYILMEMGQPLHAFDYDRLRGRRIEVRRASEGERFTTLDGVERTLFADSLLICDGGGPVALAGIMGGQNSEISGETRNVLIESAYFQPQCIRRTSKRLGLRSESSYRFERGVDPDGVVAAVDRAAQLMKEVGGGEIAFGRIDVYPNPVAAPEIFLRVDKANRFLGTGLTAADMADVLRSLDMEVTDLDGNRLRVLPPLRRSDITREVDLMEEVVRLVGYDRVPVTYPRILLSAVGPDPHLRARGKAKEFLTGAGFHEVLTYSFIPQESLAKLRLAPEDTRIRPILLRNPLSEEQAAMRTTLLPGLLLAAARNLGYSNDDFRIFELSKVFLPRAGESLPAEPHHLTGIMTGLRTPQLLYGGTDELAFEDVKGVVESLLDLFFLGEQRRYAAESLPPWLHPFRSATVWSGERMIGALGRLHPDVEVAFDLKRAVLAFELDFDALFDARGARPFFRSLPRFPSVARDMALVVSEALAVEEVSAFVRDLKEPLLEAMDIFDIYRNPQLGGGRKSVGYRLVYRSAERSLRDEEINEIHGRLVDKVLARFGATLR